MKFPKEYEPFFVYVDELIRENARLAIQHEADRQRILALSDRAEMLEAEAATGRDAAEACEAAMERAQVAEDKLGEANAMLRRAIRDLHFVMADGDACTVCKNKCPRGTADACEPRWRGEEAKE